MRDIRGELEVETLLKIVLGLVAVLLVLEILGTIVSWLAVLTPLLLLVVALVIVLWLFDRL